MKVCIAIIAFAFVAQVVSTDWKEDLLRENWEYLTFIVDKQTKDLQDTADELQKGFHCIDPVLKEFDITLAKAQENFKYCLDKNDEEDEAITCFRAFSSVAVRLLFGDYRHAMRCIENA